MPLPRGFQGKISPDGSHIAYRMNNSWDDERRNYRGGQNRPIWIVDTKTWDLVSPPWTDSKDIDPAWLDGVTSVGVTSGASVPENLVEGVLTYLADHGYPDAEAVHTAEESLIFALPPELRRDLRASQRG